MNPTFAVSQLDAPISIHPAIDELAQTRSLLFCGENDMTAALLTSIFSAEEFTISITRSARTLIDELARAVPDILLIDAQSPVLDGAALFNLLRLREGLEAMPILLLAPEGVTLPHHAGDMVHSGPISSLVLREIVDRLLTGVQ